MSTDTLTARYEWRQMHEAANRLTALLAEKSRPTPRQALDAVRYLMDDWVIARLGEALLESLATPTKAPQETTPWRKPLETCLQLLQRNMAAKIKQIPEFVEEKPEEP